MIDYLLCFPDRATAIGFGNANGYSTTDPVTGETFTNLGTHEYAMSIIGEYFTETGNMIEFLPATPASTVEIDGEVMEEIPAQPATYIAEKTGDGKHWVLFRDIKETVEVPPSAEQFIFWASDSGEDRPTDAPDRYFG